MQKSNRGSWWDLERIVSLKINYCCLSFDLVRRDVSLGGLKYEGKRKCRTECFSVNYQRDWIAQLDAGDLEVYMNINRVALRITKDSTERHSVLHKRNRNIQKVSAEMFAVRKVSGTAEVFEDRGNVKPNPKELVVAGDDVHDPAIDVFVDLRHEFIATRILSESYVQAGGGEQFKVFANICFRIT
jgi:hypothetical protein